MGGTSKEWRGPEGKNRLRVIFSRRGREGVEGGGGGRVKTTCENSSLEARSVWGRQWETKEK